MVAALSCAVMLVLVTVAEGVPGVTPEVEGVAEVLAGMALVF
jgi:hypothetical protein